MTSTLSPLLDYYPAAVVNAADANEHQKLVRHCDMQINLMRTKQRTDIKDVCALCEVNPDLLADLIALKQQTSLIELVSPLALALALASNYEALEILDEPASNTDEAMEVTLRYAKVAPKPMRRHHNEYFAGIKDPNRLFRFGLLEEAQAMAAANPDTPETKCYLWWMEKGPLPEEMPEEYRYRASLSLLARTPGADQDAVEVAQQAADRQAMQITSPRWAYEFLRAGLATGGAALIKLHEVLHTSPAWTAQYISVKDFPASEASLHLGLCTDNVHPEWLMIKPWEKQYLGGALLEASE